jgi:hypothetical protein
MKKILFLLFAVFISHLTAEINFAEQYHISLYFKELTKYQNVKYYSADEFRQSEYFTDLECIGFTLKLIHKNTYILDFFYKLKSRKETSSFFYAKEISMLPYQVLLVIQNLQYFEHDGFMISDFSNLNEFTLNPVKMLSLFLTNEPLYDMESQLIQEHTGKIEIILLELEPINKPALFSQNYIPDFFISVYYQTDWETTDRKITIKNKPVTSAMKQQVFPLISAEQLQLLRSEKVEKKRQFEQEEKQRQQERLASIQAEREEKERLAKTESEKLEKERLAKIEAQSSEQEQLKKVESEKLEKERLAKTESEKLEKERLAKIEAQKLEQEQLKKVESEKLEKERLAKAESEKLEKERLAKIEAQKLEQEQLKKVESEKLEKERLTKAESEKLEKERLAKIEAQKLEQEQLKKVESEKLEKERLAKTESEKLEKERLAKIEAQKLEQEQLKKVESEKLEKERLAKAESEKLEKERVAKIEAQKLEQEQLKKVESEKLEKERLAKTESEKLEKERLAKIEAELHARLLYDEEIKKKETKFELQLAINPIKTNFQTIDVATTKFEYSIEGIDFLYRDYLDLLTQTNLKKLAIQDTKQALQFRILCPRGYTVENAMAGTYYSIQLQQNKSHISLNLQVSELPKVPIIFIDKSEILPVEWLGVDKLVKHLQKNVPISGNYAFFFTNSERLNGGFYQHNIKEIEDLIWDDIYPLSTHSGIRYEHILPLGEKWANSGLTITYFPEIHLFLSHATMRALTTQPNSQEQSTLFLSQLFTSAKEKKIDIFVHVADSPQNPLDFSKITIPYILIK